MLQPEKTQEQIPPSLWLRADYTTHIFHYRMPETVAIASVNPVVPSPLTVQMGMIASFLREGSKDKAEKIVNALPWLQVKIRPPQGAIIFRTFLRYTRVPEAGKKSLAETGGIYGVSPHTREYALWSDYLSVYVRVPEEIEEIATEALEKIPYLGAKDSLVTCLGVKRVEPVEGECVTEWARDFMDKTQGGFIVRLADFDLARIEGIKLIDLIPTQRTQEHYKQPLYFVPGGLTASGKTKIYRRNS